MHDLGYKLYHNHLKRRLRANQTPVSWRSSQKSSEIGFGFTEAKPKQVHAALYSLLSLCIRRFDLLRLITQVQGHFGV